MSVSVIIPNLHSPLIGDVLKALRHQSAYFSIREIIVVGMDRYNLVVPDQLVQVIHTERPVCAAEARNRGARAAKGDYLLFVDADCLLTPDALEQLLATVGDYGAIVGGIVPEGGSYWRLCSNLMAFPEYLSVDEPGERVCLPSFCLLVPRRVWEEVGPFDQQFEGASGEDLDLSFRMRAAGYHLGCQPAARVYHRPARTSLGSAWHHFVSFGIAWPVIRERYAHMLPFSQSTWVNERWGALGAGVSVPIACAFVLRLMLRRKALRPFWYAIPGMIWMRLGWYRGLQFAAQQALRADT